MEGSITQLGLSNYLINREDKGSSAVALSFFKHTYKNYNNFVIDSRRVSFRNATKFGSRCVCRLDEDARYGDLISNIQLEVTLPDLSALRDNTDGIVGYCDGVGNALATNIELRINSELVDAHPPIWRDIWAALSTKPGQLSNYKAMIKKSDDGISYSPSAFQGGKVYVPLQFWFSQASGTYDTTNWIFPLVAFANNTIEINVEFARLVDVVKSEHGGSIDSLSTVANNFECNLIIDYVILEEIDRVAYISKPQQLYLMNQVQFQQYSVPAGAVSSTLSLKPFKYLISELVFVFQADDAVAANDYFNYSNTTNLFDRMSPFSKVSLSFDGRDKFRDMDTTYFTQLVPLKCHTNGNPNVFIHCYSFALQPENWCQPTGVCNFSEIHEPLLHVEMIRGLPAGTIWVFALNYNVLRTNKDGGVWLLHSMSKRVPYSMPNPDKQLDPCMDSLN